MCSGFFNTVVHQEFAPHGWTVKAEFYCNILRHLREKIQHKRPELYWNGCMWILKFTCNFGPNNTMVSLFYSHLLELAPCNLFLFSKMKFKLKGRCFDCLAGEICLGNSSSRELTSIAEALREHKTISVGMAGFKSNTVFDFLTTTRICCLERNKCTNFNCTYALVRTSPFLCNS